MILAPLDRPVWNMLTGRQAGLAVAGGAAVRIDPAFGPFAAARDHGEAAQTALGGVLRGARDEIWIVEPDEWPVPAGTRAVRTAPLVQMVAENPAAMQPGDEQAELLGDDNAADMAALAYATQPGPWGAKTRLYGDYFGFRRDGTLAAMAGERMQPGPGLGEVSGVCTWPQFQGKGLAAGLTRRVMAGLVARGEMPFLHCYAENARAIGLYETLGFRIRRAMVVTVLALA